MAAQLAAFPDIKTRIVDQKSGPLRLGQADGIACRTMEMFEAFGFSERVLKEAYWVNETSFWKPNEKQRGHIVRTGRIQDVEDGLSSSPCHPEPGGSVKLTGVSRRLEQGRCRLEHPRNPRSVGWSRRLVSEALFEIAVENGRANLKQKMGATL